MKGLKVIKARPSNLVDLQPLLKEAQEEGILFDKPTEKQMQDFKILQVIPQLAANIPMWYLAQRGKGFWGMMQVMPKPRQWDGVIDTLYVNLLYVKKERRKMGIGKMLIEQLRKDAENVGIKKIEFLATDDDMKLFEKKHKAKKIQSYGRIEL